MVRRKLAKFSKIAQKSTSDFCLEQPRVKQLGYGAVIDHVGGKLSTFGEAASIPFAENDQIFDHRGEQKLS